MQITHVPAFSIKHAVFIFMHVVYLKE